MDKSYSPRDIEARLYARWEADGRFKPQGRGAPYAIVIPPPNVTGTLHMGHAFQDTIMDALSRYHRMRGDDTLWQPGTDHAGIATQMVVERQLNAEGRTRHELGREQFVARVWQWKEQSGGTIAEQLRRLGASVDWSRDRFTMDPGLSRAVTETFVRLHDEGLIYRGKRLVNWDPVLHTALSDLEVLSEEEPGHLWHLRYPLADSSGELVVATTRPETMFGDTAVAVHQDDKRTRHLIGRRVRLPLSGREIPIVADEFVDRSFGSGCVKITPAHDFNDYEVAQRHGLPLINILDQNAALNDQVPAPYRGLDRLEARRRVVADLEAAGLLAKVEPHALTVPRGDRSHAVIEPWLTDQWYVSVAALAQPAVEAVASGRIRFVPANWDRTYFEWMRNVKDWCISRQLWWGHRIPAWYAPDGSIYVGRSEADVRARHGLAAGQALRQDDDVLDTWFSAALWPYSTLGWPEPTPELAKFYPTAVLVTGFDIIFFWVARMMMMGLHFMKQVPFKDVYIHALVRDAAGAKMSKSKGNSLDPLTLVDKYGADALRFTLAAMAAQGRDIKLAEPRIEGYRNFGTKLWNAARFCQMNECAWWEEFDPATAQQTVNCWIIGETARTAAIVTREIEALRFNEAAGALYKLVWNVFCDWYLELVKPLLNGEDEAAKIETRRTAAWTLDRILMLLHPFMPFMTEELWARLSESGPKRAHMLLTQAWPDLPATMIDAGADAEIDWIIRLISETRALRSEMIVPPGARIPLMLVGATQETAARLERYQGLIDRLGRFEYSTSADVAPPGAVTFVLDEATVALPLEGVVDFKTEVVRLGKEIARLDSEAGKIRSKLCNAQFIERAPEEVVEEQRERLADTEATSLKLAAALERLKAASWAAD